jgi:hypothetical protein
LYWGKILNKEVLQLAAAEALIDEAIAARRRIAKKTRKAIQESDPEPYYGLGGLTGDDAASYWLRPN